MPLPEDRLRSIIESIVLLSAEPVPLPRLAEVIRAEDPSTDVEAIRSAADALLLSYGDPDRSVGRGFRIEEIAGSLQYRTAPENAPYVRVFVSAKPQRLSKAALETLAVIAYRQPVTKPEIETIRGVDSGAVLKQLLEHDLVRIIGKREEIGRPIIYGTTKHFLEFFGVRSLSELPTLREYHELDEDHQAQLDELGGPPNEPPKVSELAHAAQFLVEVKDDPDLDALDEAVHAADRVRHAAELALDPSGAKRTPSPPPGEFSEGEASSTLDVDGTSLQPEADSEHAPGAGEHLGAEESYPS